MLLFSLAVPASALELEAPPVPKAGEDLMPDNSSSFSEGFQELLEKAINRLIPDLREASRVSLQLICVGLLLGVLNPVSSGASSAVQLIGTLLTASSLLLTTRSMLPLASDTIRQMSDYGNLLLPVMTAALAAQGGVTASAALYAGTAAFSALLGKIISGILLPMVYLFLALSTAHAAAGEEILKRLRDIIKSFASWCLKILLTVFTTYMSITGVISGTTDAAALKAAKVTISTVVPVVGGILSDASETVLVSAGLMKNAAGIYGILAVLAIYLAPFLKIGSHYLVLKLTAGICTVLGGKSFSGLIDDFAGAMGLLLGMTGSVCLLVLISTVCYLKGVS